LWIQSLEYYFKFLTEHSFRPIKKIIFNYNSVRPKGEVLKTFGGHSSGHQSLKRMFTKLDELLSNKEPVDDLNRTKLEPIDAMDISNIIAENVVSGGVRRSSQICLFDAEDEDIAEAKSGLYKQVDGEWVIDETIAHRQMSNNSIMYYSKPSREKLHKHIEDLRFSGEPGFINAEEASRRRENFEGVNPCFTGDMKLLTAEGYKTFEELNGRNDVPVVNINGDVTKGKVWSNGVKKIVKLTLSNGGYIKCTPDHKFMLKDGSNDIAENLLGKTLKSHEGENIDVISVETFGKEEVYDFNEPVTHWGVVEGVIAHNCAEILLDSRGVCNLTSLNVMSFVEDGKLNKEELFKGQKMSARAGYRMAQIEFELNDWDIINKRDRLIGTSMTGWQDMVNATDISREEEIELLEELKEVAHDEAEKIANKLDGNVPELITTVKPEGCTTKDHTRTIDQGVLFLDEINPDIYEKDEFDNIEKGNYSFNGYGIDRTYTADKKDILKVTLNNGRELKLTPSHPVSVNNKWLEAKELNVGDVINYELGNYDKEVDEELLSVSTDEFRKGDNGMMEYDLPDYMNEDLSWLVGAYYANGSFPKDKDKVHQSRIKFHCQHLAVHKKVQRIWKKQFGVETNIVKSNDRDSYTQDFGSVKIRKWFKKNGMLKESNKNFNRIPEVIRRSSKDTILSYIIGYADNDGCFHNETFCIDSINDDFIRHLQEVGEAVGISFSFIVNSERKGGYSDNNMYKCYMSRFFTDKYVFNYVNKKSVKAQERPVVNSVNCRSAEPYQVKSIEVLKDMNTYDIEVNNIHWYYQGGLRSHNTQTQMPTVSSGLHFSHSSYYIRRVRISASDPLVETAEDLGWNVKNEVGQEGEDLTTKVIEFPVKAPEGKVKGDVSAIEQLEIYKMFMEHYVDHNASITVHVRDDEWEDVEEWLWNNWDSVVGVSFISYSDNFYDLMPYEEITEEEYNEMVEDMEEFKPSLINEYERKNKGLEREINDAACESGICPVR
jgi:intein/homing endonuclease